MKITKTLRNQYPRELCKTVLYEMGAFGSTPLGELVDQYGRLACIYVESYYDDTTIQIVEYHQETDDEWDARILKIMAIHKKTQEQKLKDKLKGLSPKERKSLHSMLSDDLGYDK